MSRKQCKKCPWRIDTDPTTIPGGYSVDKHKNLKNTVATPGALNISDELQMMACHETPRGKEKSCVGWLVNQLGPGNNIELRLSVIAGRVDGDVETEGEQHACFEDTLP